MSAALLASYGTIPFRPDLAAAVLRLLALRRAGGWHRARNGAGYAEPPLFLILLDEHRRWTGDARLARTFEPQARAALRWLEWYGDPDGDGYLEYRAGDRAPGLAPAELQGYGYGARRRAARLAREVWRDPELARRLDREARALRRRFDADFWLPGPGWYTRALDGRKRPLPALAATVGHLLWSGIVAPERVAAIANRLRRLRESVQDAALAAIGLYAYGRREEAGRLAVALRKTVPRPGHGLPGQAAGAPPLLLRVLLGIDREADPGLTRPVGTTRTC